MTTISDTERVRALLKELRDAQQLGRDDDSRHAVCSASDKSWNPSTYYPVMSLTKAEARMIGEWKEEIIQRELRALGLEVASV